jgi:uncharacterized protein (TIGR00730 family)
MRICVFCGSRPGRPFDVEVARSLGRSLADKGHELIYGGASVGLMGVLASEMLLAGGKVTGVLPSILSGREIAAESLTEMVVVETLAERKSVLFERADAFIVLPGGVGTLDELFDLLVITHLGLSNKPIAVVDVDRFYESLEAMIDKMVIAGFVDGATTCRLTFHETSISALDWLEADANDSMDLDFSILVPATMTDTWAALVEPALTSRWLFGTTLDAVPRTGCQYTFRSADGKPALTGIFRNVKPPFLLEMSFSAIHSANLASESASILRWRLLPRGKSTAIELRHHQLAQSPATAMRAAKDWPIALRALSDLLSAPPRDQE